MPEIIVALDNLNREEAENLAYRLAGKVWGFKVNDALLAYGAQIQHSLKPHGKVMADPKLFDIPQTVANAAARLAEFSDIITIHAEATDDPVAVLQQIRNLDCGVGIALNPATPLLSLAGCLDLCDLVLVMSVPAGFGGQAFQPVALDKLRALRKVAREDVLLEVDGGINTETIRSCVEAGAQLIVAGSAIFRTVDYGPALRELHALASPN